MRSIRYSRASTSRVWRSSRPSGWMTVSSASGGAPRPNPTRNQPSSDTRAGRRPVQRRHLGPRARAEGRPVCAGHQSAPRFALQSCRTETERGTRGFTSHDVVPGRNAGPRASPGRKRRHCEGGCDVLNGCPDAQAQRGEKRAPVQSERTVLRCSLLLSSNVRTRTNVPRGTRSFRRREIVG